jgi:hypothetical protein
MLGRDSELSGLIRGFEYWLVEHFKIQASSHSVYEIVDSYSHGPGHALTMFYTLFEQFYESRGRNGLEEAKAHVSRQPPSV